MLYELAAIAFARSTENSQRYLRQCCLDWQFVSAIEGLAWANQRFPENVGFHAALARCHFETGDIDKALAECNELLRQSPKAAEAYAVRGRIYAEKKLFEPVLKDFDQAIEVGSADAVTRCDRGFAHAAAWGEGQG